MEKIKIKDSKFLRKHRLSFVFNDFEQDALDKYCRKYNINNKSKFMRETIVKTILKQFEDDYPSLFPEFDKQNS